MPRADGRLDSRGCREYWDAAHAAADDLAAVCFPGKPPWFNLFFDRVQRHALSGVLERRGITLDGARALDLGCGRGRWTAWLGRRGARATGIDLSEAAVQRCRELGLDARHGSLDRMPFEDASFDLALSVTVLMHLPAEVKAGAAAEITRILRPGGTLVMIEGTGEDSSAHVHNLDVPGWRRLFEARGMRLAEVSGHCFDLLRRTRLARTAPGEWLAVHLDYPLEWALMAATRGRCSALALQHVMVFGK